MTRRLSVLHVIPSLAASRGGPSYVLRRLAPDLAARGIDVTVLATRADLAAGEEARVRDEIGPGVRLVLVDLIEWRRLEVAPALVPSLARLLPDVDVAHLHTVFTFPVAAPALLCRASRVPFIIRPAGTLDGACLALGRASAKRVAIATYVRPALRAAAAVHVTTAFEAAEIARIAPRARTVISAPGVDVDAAIDGDEAGERDALDRVDAGAEASSESARTVGTGSTGRRIGYLGRLTEKKGVDLLIDAVARLPRDVRLDVLGDGDPSYVAALRARASRLGLSDRVRFRGHIEGRDKRRALAACELWAFPSLDENFGVAVAEAMAAGRPVVVTPGVALAEEVRRAGAGLVVDRGIDGVARGVAALLDDEAQRRTMGAAGRALVAARYSRSAAADRLVALYQEIADR